MADEDVVERIAPLHPGQIEAVPEPERVVVPSVVRGVRARACAGRVGADEQPGVREVRERVVPVRVAPGLEDPAVVRVVAAVVLEEVVRAFVDVVVDAVRCRPVDGVVLIDAVEHPSPVDGARRSPARRGHILRVVVQVEPAGEFVVQHDGHGVRRQLRPGDCIPGHLDGGESRMDGTLLLLDVDDFDPHAVVPETPKELSIPMDPDVPVVRHEYPRGDRESHIPEGVEADRGVRADFDDVAGGGARVGPAYVVVCEQKTASREDHVAPDYMVPRDVVSKRPDCMNRASGRDDLVERDAVIVLTGAPRSPSP